MANVSAWVGTGSGGTAARDRAADAWQRISEKPSSVIITRRVANVNTQLPAQTVRAEYSTQQSSAEAKGGAGMSSVQRVILFGIRGHATLADTDIQRDDKLTLDGLQLRVISVIKQTGEIQANCEAQG